MRSKETEELLTLIRSIDHHFLLYWLWPWIYSNIFLCDHRLTSFRQLDLQEAGKLTLKFQAILNAKENIFIKLKSKIPKIDRVDFFKSKQNIFPQIWLWSQINPL
jgi:hypothetical protein